MKAYLWLALAMLLTPGPLALGTETTKQEGVENETARRYFTDVRLVDHEGREHRLYSDLMAGRVVIINALFTTCQGVCPVTSANLQKVQSWLGDRLGEEVYILSLTVDPETDTSDRLATYARGLGARPGWFFLTAPRDRLDFALTRLGLETENKEAHSPVFLIGNVPTGLWKKAVGLASSEELIQILDSVLLDRLETTAGAR